MLRETMNRRRFLVLSTAAASVSKAATTASDGPLITFGLTTDVQYADADPQGERHYRESIPKLKAVVADLAKENLPFTLHLGDVIDRDFASFAMVLPLFEPLGHPVRHLLGNHDYSIVDALKSQVVKTLGMPADYYAFRSSGVRFLMLDTCEVSVYKHPEGSAEVMDGKNHMKALAARGAKNAKPWNGGMSAKQLAWVETQLKEADAAKEPTILCGHHPIFPEDAHQLWNHRELLGVIEGHPSARAYLCGHNHAGAEAAFKGVPCITFKSVLHEPGVTSYAVLSLFHDKLVIRGRGREVSREIALRAM